MTTLLHIGQRLRDVRLATGQFKKTLAESSGINRNTLHNLESGTGNVELNTLLAVCDTLGLDILLVPRAVADKQRSLASSTIATPAGSFITRSIAARASKVPGRSAVPALPVLPDAELPEEDPQ